MGKLQCALTHDDITKKLLQLDEQLRVNDNSIEIFEQKGESIDKTHIEDLKANSSRLKVKTNAISKLILDIVNSLTENINTNPKELMNELGITVGMSKKNKNM